jgi:hypothetical protein
MKHWNDDMDELFKRSGNDYPLRTGESEWDTIAQRLQNTPVTSKKKNRKRYKGLIMLFLTIGLLASLLTQLTNRNFSPGYKILSDQPGYVGSSNPGKSQDLIKQKEDIATSHISQNISVVNRQKTKKNVIDNSSALTIQTKQGRIATTSLTRPSGSASFPSYTDTITGIIEKRVIPEIEQPEDPGKQTEFATPKNKKKYGFYAGFVTGPQLNEVKSQGMRKLSIGLGIVGGYRFSRNISLETGIHFSKKHYFSDGKYFNMKNPDPAMPPDMKVLTIEGNSSLFEWPVKLRYDLLQKNKTTLFSSAGISSYFLIKEKNNYVTMMNGNQDQMTGNYKNTNRYIAAAINLSAGYEYKTGNQNSIRLEPYIQIPIKGIGVGSMPVTSAGLHIGIIWNNK